MVDVILICTFCPILGLYEVEIRSIIVVIAIENGISSVEGHSQTVSRFGAAFCGRMEGCAQVIRAKPSLKPHFVGKAL